MSVTPEGIEVVVASSFNSNGGAYHRDPDCKCIAQIKSPKRVDVSVAEWKGLEPCGVCGD